MKFKEALQGRGRAKVNDGSTANQGPHNSILPMDDRLMVDFSNKLCPKVIITDEEYKQFCFPWRDSLVIKVLVKHMGFKALWNRLSQLWNTGVISI